MNIIETNFIFKGSLGNRKSTKYIALHHAGVKSATPESIHNYHLSKGWSGIGYHFYIRKDGLIYRGRPIYSVGAHVSGQNSISLGICAEGDYSTEQSMPIQQKRSIAELLDYLKNIFPNAQIVGHKEIGSSDCPGKYYPLAQLKRYEEILKGGKQMEHLKKEVQELKNKIEEINKRFNSIEEIPDYAKEDIKKLVDEGVIKGDGKNLNLSEDMIRVLMMQNRMK